MTGTMIARGLMVGLGVLLVLGGLALATVGGLAVIGLSVVAAGLILILAAGFEVMRYRSEAAEKARATPGPGGGEPERPESRFQPTDEVFVDPTTQRRMRVYADSRTGERRYVAEG